ncbi:MAG: M48 family metalloprotease [Myxococcales bacterium]|nr:M48 family metalloprotease [Myxococcales bacterium]
MTARFLLSLFAGLALACASRAPGARAPTPDAADSATGQLVSELMLGGSGPVADPDLERYIARVGTRVALAGPRLPRPLRFRVTDDASPTAYSLPGGEVLVSRGALVYLDSEAELAAVLAHEIAHAARGHTDVARSALPADARDGDTEAALLDRDEERQADALAVSYLASAGYDPHAVGRAFDALARAVRVACWHDTSRTDCDTAHDPDDPHPSALARRARAELLAGAGRGRVERARYLQAIEGLLVGAREAKLESGRFFTADGLSFPLPPGLTPLWSGHLFTATGVGTELLIARFYGRFLREALKSSLRAAPYTTRTVAGRRVLIGALSDDHDHAVALLEAGPFVHLVAVSGLERDALLERLLAGASAAPAPADERVLSIVPVREAGRFSAWLARHCPGTEAQFAAALNGIAPGARLATGQLVKCTRPK